MATEELPLLGVSGARYEINGPAVRQNIFGDAVYPGRDQEGSKVAIKKLKNGKEGSSFEQYYYEGRLIEREWDISEVMRRFKHDHLLLITDRCVSSGYEYYVMPWAEVLKDRVGKVGDEEALKIISDLAKGLQELSTASVVHRDIKPGNALLWQDVWRHADFGISKVLTHDGTVTRHGDGTWDYFAPELFKGERATILSDIYALGCLAYELCSGSPPFASFSDKRAAHEFQQPEKLNSVGPVLSRAIFRMLFKNPLERPQTAQDILSLLEVEEGGSVLRARLLRLEEIKAKRLSLQQVEVAKVEQKKLLLEQAVAQLEVMIEDVYEEIQSVADHAKFRRDDHVSAWVVEYFDSSLSIALAGGFEKSDDLICMAVAKISTSAQVASDYPSFNLVCEETSNGFSWYMLKFHANQLLRLGSSIGPTGEYKGLVGEQLWSAWRRRGEAIAPAIVAKSEVTSEILLDVFLSAVESEYEEEPANSQDGINPPVPEREIRVTSRTSDRHYASVYETAVFNVLQSFGFDEVIPEPDRGAFDFRVNSPMGSTMVECKFRARGGLSVPDLRRVIERLGMGYSDIGLVVVTNLPLSASVREVNSLGGIDGFSVEAVTWNGPEDSDLLHRAIGRSFRRAQ